MNITAMMEIATIPLTDIFADFRMLAFISITYQVLWPFHGRDHKNKDWNAFATIIKALWKR